MRISLNKINFIDCNIRLTYSLTCFNKIRTRFKIWWIWSPFVVFFLPLHNTLFAFEKLLRDWDSKVKDTGRIFRKVNKQWSIRYRGVGRVCFLPPPLFCPTKFVKSSDQFFERKAHRRRKNFEVTFFKKLTFLGKFYGF